MANIVNPTEVLYFDILYYIFILFLGPVTLWFLILFRPRQRRLIDQYIHTGVQCQGIVTHRKVTVRRGALTGIEQSRSYQLRYAYKAPGTDIVFIKDFVSVPKEVCLQQRQLPVRVLPGQPTTGVPEFIVQTKFWNEISISILAIISLITTGFGVYVFGALYAIFLFTDCDAITHTCYLTWSSIACGGITFLALGLLFAYICYVDARKRVPGRVWKQIIARRGAGAGAGASGTVADLPTASATAIGQVPAPQQQQQQQQQQQAVLPGLDDGEIPVADVVSVLQNTADPSSTSTNTAATMEGQANDVSVAPQAQAIELAAPYTDAVPATDEEENNEDIPTAKAFELV